MPSTPHINPKRQLRTLTVYVVQYPVPEGRMAIAGHDEVNAKLYPLELLRVLEKAVESLKADIGGSQEGS